MKVIRYALLVVLASSPLCYGFVSERIKHASAGAGKLGLGLICALMGASVAQITNPVAGEGDVSLLGLYAHNSRARLVNDGPLHLLFSDPSCPTSLDRNLTMALTMSSMIGMCTYGAYKCAVSAGKSFKKACNGGKKPTPSIDSKSSKPKVKVSQNYEIEVQVPKKGNDSH